jgi:hypothetical protein
VTGKKKFKKTNIFIIVLLSIVVYLALYKVLQTSSNISFEEVYIGVTFSPDSNPVVYTNNSDSFFVSTRNSIKLININGETMWEYSYNIQSPVMVGAGDTIALVDTNRNTIYAFNKEGNMYTRGFYDNIVNFNINENGYSSIILINEDFYTIKVLDSTGYQIMSLPITEENIFPTSVSISNDNRILTYTTIDINNIEIVSNLVFVYINEEDSRASGTTVFSINNYPGQIMAMLNYVNNTFVAVSNKGIYGYNIGRNDYISQNFNVQVENNINKIDFSNDGRIVVAYGVQKIQNEGLNANTVRIYNSSGGLTGAIEMENEITYLMYSLNTVIVGTNRNFFGINRNGNIVWEHTFTKDVNQIMYLNDERSILVVGNTEITLLQKRR